MGIFTKNRRMGRQPTAVINLRCKYDGDNEEDEGEKRSEEELMRMFDSKKTCSEE